MQRIAAYFRSLRLCFYDMEQILSFCQGGVVDRRFKIFYTAGYTSQWEEKEFFSRGLFVTYVFSMSYESPPQFASIFQGGFAPMGKKSVSVQKNRLPRLMTAQLLRCSLRHVDTLNVLYGLPFQRFGFGSLR